MDLKEKYLFGGSWKRTGSKSALGLQGPMILSAGISSLHIMAVLFFSFAATIKPRNREWK